MTSNGYVMFEKIDSEDPFRPLSTPTIITKYYCRCYIKECDFCVKNFCTCVSGRCFAEELNENFDFSKRDIIYLK